MEETNKGALFRRLKLVGQPYWFGAIRWNAFEIICALLVAGLTVVALNVGVSLGSHWIIAQFAKLDPAAVQRISRYMLSTWCQSYWPRLLAIGTTSALIAMSLRS